LIDKGRNVTNPCLVSFSCSCIQGAKPQYSAVKAVDLAVITLRRGKNELDFTNTSLDLCPRRSLLPPIPSQKITVTPIPKSHPVIAHNN
jgi:hypothetical protein